MPQTFPGIELRSTMTKFEYNSFHIQRSVCTENRPKIKLLSISTEALNFARNSNTKVYRLSTFLNAWESALTSKVWAGRLVTLRSQQQGIKLLWQFNFDSFLFSMKMWIRDSYIVQLRWTLNKYSKMIRFSKGVIPKDTLWLVDLENKTINICTELFSELTVHSWVWPRVQRTQHEAIIRLCRERDGSVRPCGLGVHTLSASGRSLESWKHCSVKCSADYWQRSPLPRVGGSGVSAWSSTSLITASVSSYPLLGWLLYHDELLFGTNVRQNIRVMLTASFVGKEDWYSVYTKSLHSLKCLYLINY